MITEQEIARLRAVEARLRKWRTQVAQDHESGSVFWSSGRMLSAMERVLGEESVAQQGAVGELTLFDEKETTDGR